MDRKAYEKRMTYVILNGNIGQEFLADLDEVRKQLDDSYKDFCQSLDCSKSGRLGYTAKAIFEKRRISLDVLEKALNLLRQKLQKYSTNVLFSIIFEEKSILQRGSKKFKTLEEKLLAISKCYDAQVIAEYMP